MLLTLSLVVTIATNVLIFLLVGYYFLRLREKEKVIEKKDASIDINYHHVVDEALSKERKILDDATTQADKIIGSAQDITGHTESDVDKAVKELVASITKEGEGITRAFTSEYTGSLKQLTMQSLTEFHSVMLGMQTGLKQQIVDFNQHLLPQIEKELEVYKQEKMKSIDQTVMTIIQKASQEIFNKSLSGGDHQTIVTDALEKAKKEGVFD